MRILGILLLLLVSCSKTPQEEFRLKGKKIVLEIVDLLQDVENHDELEAISPQLRKQYRKLAGILLEIRTFREKHPNELFPENPIDESEELFAQLARLYEIPGCREIMERSQADAVYLLLRD